MRNLGVAAALAPALAGASLLNLRAFVEAGAPVIHVLTEAEPAGWGFQPPAGLAKLDLSEFRYRPFTLEGNFLAMEAVHEMLLQSWGEKVRVFPAVPDAWADAEFRDLRAEGGHRVSAKREGGRTVRVEVVVGPGGRAVLRDPFQGGEAAWPPPRPERAAGAGLILRGKPGSRFVGEAR